MLFLTKVKPNINCMIFGCDLRQQEFCCWPDCSKCGRVVYDYYFRGYWPSLELDTRLEKVMYRIERFVNGLFSRKKNYFLEEDEIPF